MGKGSTTETKTVQDNTPWGPAQGPLMDVYSQAGQAYAATPKTAYSGSYIAPQSQSTILAQMMGTGLAGKSMNMGDQVAKNAQSIQSTSLPLLQQASTKAANPTQVAPVAANLGSSDQFASYLTDFLGKSQNPYLLDAAKAMNDPLQQTLQEKLIPQAKLNAVGSGTYGGDAGTIDMAQIINDNFTRTAQNNNAQLALQDYNTRFGAGTTAAGDFFNRSLTQGTTNADIAGKNADRELAGAQMLPGLVSSQNDINKSFAEAMQNSFALNALPIDTLAAIGQQQDQYSQDTVAALYKQWQDSIMAPWQGLEQYRGAISGYPTSSTGTSTANSKSSGGLF